METLYYSTFDSQSPVGKLTIGVSDRGLALVSFHGAESLNAPQFREVKWQKSESKTAPYRRELLQYLKGQRKRFEIPLDLRGTDFQMRCWNALLRIPFGETRSYAEIARQVGSPRGFRAVGSANHQNPVAIVVPCHRVIESNGKLGGYGGGLYAKEWLLELEGITSDTPRLF